MKALVFAFSLAALATTSHALTVQVQPSQGKVEFHATGRPSMIKINGEGKGPEGILTIGADKKVTGELTFDMTSLNSGIGLRDSHMKEKYLEVEKYPQAKLKLTDVSLPETTGGKLPSVKAQPFKGELTMHGQTKPISGTFDLEGKTAKADFEINIAEYGIEIPKYLGITVKNEVPVELTLNDLQVK